VGGSSPNVPYNYESGPIKKAKAHSPRFYTIGLLWQLNITGRQSLFEQGFGTKRVFLKKIKDF
jgi:hypothetical protein